MSEVKLLPCPFCGEAEHLMTEHLEGTVVHPAYRVLCDNCGASTGYTDKDCRKVWNERANMEPLLRERDALRNRLEDTVRDLTDVKAENERLRTEVAEYANTVQGYIDTIAEADAQAERLAEALRKAREDINWMLNNRQFLNSFVFDYIDAALDQEGGNGWLD